MPTASQMGAPATHKSTKNMKNMKKGALGENPEKCAKMYRNWGPRTLEIYVFIKERLQKSYFPPSSKNHTKCFPKCHQNGAKSNKFQLRRSPRKHSKNKRRKQRNLDSKSRGGGPRTKNCDPKVHLGGPGGPLGSKIAPRSSSDHPKQ